MTTTPQELVGNDHGKLQEAARRHPWMHITRMSAYTDHDVAVIVRGEGAYDTTAVAAVYLDGLAGLLPEIDCSVNPRTQKRTT